MDKPTKTRTIIGIIVLDLPTPLPAVRNGAPPRWLI